MNAKSESILIRVSDVDKGRLKAAATRASKSLTTFVLDAAAKESARIEKRPPARGVHTGVPSYFKGWCYTASRGGSFGYDSVGSQLVQCLGSEMPWDIESDDWTDEVDALGELLSNNSEDAAWGWFEQHYPKMMKLIPQRRRAQFMLGVQRTYEEEGLVL